MSTTALRQTLFGNASPAPQGLQFGDDGRTPNSRHPVLIYRAATASPAARTRSLADSLETLFAAHGWPPQWRGGVFDYHHYHACAHETLGVAGGHATLILGGEQGESVEIARGDVLILPAGTGHCRLDASHDFQLVAAYPPDQQNWDLCRPGETDIATARARIEALAVPAQDPVTGHAGSLVERWRQGGGTKAQ